MALEGTLRDFSLADIFQLIGIQKKTGVLTLKYDGDEVTVSFLNGNVVSADSAKKNLEDRIGSVLVKSGRVTERQLQEALKVQKETMQRLGHILLQTKLISEADLKEALRLQITQIVYRLFRWKDGDYHFSQEESVEYDREHFAPMSAESILMEGIRMIDEWPIIERKIHSFDLVFRKTRPGAAAVVVTREAAEPAADLSHAFAGGEAPEPAARADALRMAREEALVYELIDGHRTVQEVIDGARMGDFETCRILYDLLSRGLIAAGAAAAPTKAPSRRISIALVLERLAYVTLAAAVIASAATLRRSPLSGSASLMAPPGALEEIDELICRNRVERLDEAVEIYYLQKGFYPDDLADLVKGGLVGETTLRDPWGRSFGFISTTGGYRIIAYDAGGVENPARSVSRGHIRREPPETREPGTDAARLGPAVPATPGR